MLLKKVGETQVSSHRLGLERWEWSRTRAWVWILVPTSTNAPPKAALIRKKLIPPNAFHDLDSPTLKTSLSMANSRSSKHFRFLSSVWAGTCVVSTSVGRTAWMPKRIPNQGFRLPHSGRLNLVKSCSGLYGVKMCLKSKSEQPATKQSQIIWWNF